MKSLANPILFLSDAPEASTGLARIARELAALCCTLPEFRVGYLARGGVGRRKFPWVQYSYPEYGGQWGEEYIEQVWNDFAGEDEGIIFSNWDPSRLLWFSQPVGLPAGMQKFLGSGRRFQKWGYFPIDGTGPDGKTLPKGIDASVAGFDRVVTASAWGAEVVNRNYKSEFASWIPHGIDTRIFAPTTSAYYNDNQPYNLHIASKHVVGWRSSDIHVGCVMTNQARKDWPIAFETAARLKQTYGNRFKFWCHTDALINYWNIPGLASDYGVSDCTEVTSAYADHQLALRYAACDCTILPSLGEGFGYPIAESLACGTGAVVTDYAGGPELVEDFMRVPSMLYRVDTQHNILRPVLCGSDFSHYAAAEIERKRTDWEGRGDELRESVFHLDWKRLGKVWAKWFIDGLNFK